MGKRFLQYHFVTVKPACLAVPLIVSKIRYLKCRVARDDMTIVGLEPFMASDSIQARATNLTMVVLQQADTALYLADAKYDCLET